MLMYVHVPWISGVELVPTCMDICIHVNKSSFKPLSVILLILGALDVPMLVQLHYHSGPVHE